MAIRHQQHTGLLTTASGVMEICWLSAWTHLIMMLPTDLVFPYVGVIIPFCLAAAITCTASNRGWSRMVSIGLHVCGLTLAVFLLIYTFLYPTLPLFGLAWLAKTFSMPESPKDLFILVLTFFWALVFWISGVKMARRQLSYWTVCRRFDFGILMFSGLLLLKIRLIHNDIAAQEQITSWLIIIFFVFGLMAIGLARNRQRGHTAYMAGYRTIGVILSFAIITLIAAISASSVCWPLFAKTAESGYDLLQRGFEPLLHVAIVGLTNSWRGSMDIESVQEQIEDSITAQDKLSVAVAEGGGTDILESALRWGFGSFLAVTLLGLSCFVLWRLAKWFFTRPPLDKKRTLWPMKLMIWLAAIPGFMIFCWEWFRQRLKSSSDIVQIYTALLRWGNTGGLKHEHNETPLEYSDRLGSTFPRAQSEITLIINLFQQETYAEQVVDKEQFYKAQSALKRLRSPLLWPARLYSKFRFMEKLT